MGAAVKNLLIDIRDTLSRIRARASWAHLNVGFALTCIAIALGAYWWFEILDYILTHM